MLVIPRDRLREFWELPGHSDAAGPLKSWLVEVDEANWSSLTDVLRRHPRMRATDSNRFEFDICENKYRLEIQVNFELGFLFIKSIGNRAHEDFADARQSKAEAR